MEGPGLLEWTGFVSGVTGVWLTARQNPWCFPIGLVNVAISLILFFGQRLYADALQQAVYIILLGIGWFNWTQRKEDTSSVRISESSPKERLLIFCSIAIITLSLGILLDKTTDAVFPWLDSFATALSFTAQFLIARKKIENWLLWIPVNIIYIGIYAQKELYLYVLLFTVYLGLAINGYLAWKKVKRNELPTGT